MELSITPYSTLMAVDPSLTCSGWALFDIKEECVIGVGKIKAPKPPIPLQERLLQVHYRVESLFKKVKLGKNSVLVCEEATSIKDPHSTFKVEQVRGIFECAARYNNVCVPGRINPRSVQTDLLGMGSGRQLTRNAVKEAARSFVSTVYNDQLEKIGFNTDKEALASNQDIVDAILLGALALSYIKAASLSRESLYSVFNASKRKRRSSRKGWGKGEEISFGWSYREVASLGRKK
ncbi:MAG: hypothetical protein D6808_04815 [Candidatus Dadabacteria bacterium]|nr:MAG: hypothetical protein D6808_04815 [Candidatus Dadabacteria bacterium]